MWFSVICVRTCRVCSTYWHNWKKTVTIFLVNFLGGEAFDSLPCAWRAWPATTYACRDAWLHSSGVAYTGRTEATEGFKLLLVGSLEIRVRKPVEGKVVYPIISLSTRVLAPSNRWLAFGMIFMTGAKRFRPRWWMPGESPSWWCEVFWKNLSENPAIVVTKENTKPKTNMSLKHSGWKTILSFDQLAVLLGDIRSFSGV